MSKITMPKPDIFDGVRLDGSIASHGYSTSRMESYAAAKVRKALEEAAEVAESCVCSCCCSDDQKFTAQDAAQRIRALIPSTPA